MNPYLSQLQPYPFERMRLLQQGLTPAQDKSAIALSMGEPRHPAPASVLEQLRLAMDGFSLYPATAGGEELREAIAHWLVRRFALPAGSVDASRQVLPVNGSREALFASVQCLAHATGKPLILMPNPFYQIYEGAALLAGAQPYYLPWLDTQQCLPDYERVPESVWRRTQILFLCSPANPSGAVTPLAQLQQLIEKARYYDFIILSDECYSDIYPQEAAPPPGLLQAAAAMGLADFPNLLVFHSLSKRSSLPGLRSGFVAGDARLIAPFLLYRTYHGSAMPLPTQKASIAAWNDETHVLENRHLYRQKFQAVVPLLRPHYPVHEPDASFYLWLRTPIPGIAFTLGLWQQQNVQVIPGAYLARESAGINPGEHYVRIALVPDLDTCLDACQRMLCFFQSL